MSEEEKSSQSIFEYFMSMKAMEDVEEYNKLLGSILMESSQAIQQTSDSDASLTDAIGSLSSKIQSIEDSLGLITGSSSGFEERFGQEVAILIDQQITPVKAELEAIKSEVFPSLDTAKNTIQSVEEFLQKNAAFLTSAIEAEGLLRAIQGELSSLSKRMDVLESAVNKAWDRRLTYVSLLIAAVSMAVAVYSVFLMP